MRIKIQTENAVPFPINKSPVRFKETRVELHCLSPSRRTGNNYFSIFQHVIARNSKIKQLLVEYSKNSRSTRRDSPPISNSRPDHSRYQSLIPPSYQGSSQKVELSQRTNRYSAMHPKWKETMMRRTNNGTYGKIIKGNPKNMHSCLVNLYQKEAKSQEDRRETRSLTNSKFMPLGKLYSQNEKWMQICPKASTEGDRESCIEKVGSEPSIILSKIEAKSIKNSEVQQKSKACIPMQTHFPIHKANINHRQYYLPRTMTPKPWQQT